MEFSEVMCLINRICRSCVNCLNCPLEEAGVCGNIGNHCSEPLQVERIEAAVLRWASEHVGEVYE